MPLDMPTSEVLKTYGGIVDHLLSPYFNHKFNRFTGVIDIDDIRSSGYVGLLRAAETFDPSRGTKFSHHAYNTIRGFMRNELRNGRPEGSDKETLGIAGRRPCKSINSDVGKTHVPDNGKREPDPARLAEVRDVCKFAESLLGESEWGKLMRAAIDKSQLSGRLSIKRLRAEMAFCEN